MYTNIVSNKKPYSICIIYEKFVFVEVNIEFLAGPILYALFSVALIRVARGGINVEPPMN